ncbi:hemolysin XhlA family protein [Paenibacillus sp. ACRRX]|uniref:hemolysin XhlA family protein n=1 Tax=unclassified Paenibacillus TaxID=185978 RepID=UPI001EF4A6A1|nr:MULTISPECIES: hemolysin XhlA family protein [unclassified Paenibacillus]MCG7409029.1 hemolysin XhlA family protein [Paenibacillus sp. ACRRX]MDK8181972.1 hemolysin XhlA family protein [Paenibacillus sp. UMB4589-SE434]
MDTQTRMLSEIRERVVRVETKLDSMTDVREVADDAKEAAHKALESTRSAHHRLDRIDKTIFWLATTVVGAVIMGLIKLAMDGRP